MVEDVGDVLWRAGPVDADGRGADGHGREGQGDPLGAVEAQDGDRITALDAQADQGASGIAHLTPVVLPGGGLPARCGPDAVGRMVAEPLRGLQQKLGWRHKASQGCEGLFRRHRGRRQGMDVCSGQGRS